MHTSAQLTWTYKTHVAVVKHVRYEQNFLHHITIKDLVSRLMLYEKNIL